MCDGSPKAEEHGHIIGFIPQDKVLLVSPAPPQIKTPVRVSLFVVYTELKKRRDSNS